MEKKGETATASPPHRHLGPGAKTQIPHNSLTEPTHTHTVYTHVSAPRNEPNSSENSWILKNEFKLTEVNWKEAS